MICNFMIFSESVGSGAPLSAKTSETPANVNLQGFPFPGCRPTEKKEKTSDKPRYAGLGCLQQRPSPSRYDLCSTLSKKEPMKNTDQHHPSCRQEAAQADVRQSQGMQEIPVTQITPDDILADGGPITPATEDGTPTQRQIEQDVVSVNPSADSMESRG